MMWTVVARSLAVSAVVVPLITVVPAAHAQPEICEPVVARNCAKNGVVGEHPGQDTTITGIGVVETIDCKNSTLLINGQFNRITALGSCWAVTMQGNSNVVVADNVVNDITVYGWDQLVLYKGGEPAVWDRGRELGMTNRIDRVPA
jgi:hypothetical protein